MNYPIYRVILLSVLFALSSCVYGEDDVDIILNKLVHKSNSSIDKELSMFEERSGSFRDINYADSSRVYWMPVRHLERINHFTEVYINPISRYYKFDYLYNIILKGLEYWNKQNPYCNNWWFNEIAVPQQIGLILLNMRSSDGQKLPVVLERELIKKMEESVKDPRYFTGANRTDIVIHWIYRACLTKNEFELQRAVNLFFEPLKYSLSEGITIDNSYLQHGRQLYIGGYAIRFLDSTTKIASLLMGTKYAPPKQQLNILYKFARDTFFRTIRGKYFSYNVVGRNISRKGALKDSVRVIEIAQRLKELDPINVKEYDSVILRMKGELNPSSNITTSFFHYYYSDYSLYTCPLYTFDVRLSSIHTRKCELLNNENLKGYFLSEGSQCLMVNGDEYDEIFPVWNWSRIPGVTAPQIRTVPRLKAGAFGVSNIAGGVTDSLYGATAFVFSDTLFHTQAKKSWFFFDKEIVCLGSDVCSNSVYPIETTLNQCMDNKNTHVYYCSSDSIYDVQEIQEVIIPNTSWVMHNHVGYVFPRNEKVVLSKWIQQGNWSEINHDYFESEIRKGVFNLGISHGKKPKGQKYAYIIIPNIQSYNVLKDYLENSKIEIVCLSNSIHAVYDSEKDVLQVIFFKPDELHFRDAKVTVNSPCCLIIDGGYTGIHPIVHLANLQLNKPCVSFTISTRGRNLKKEVDFRKTGRVSGESIRIDF